MSSDSRKSTSPAVITATATATSSRSAVSNSTSAAPSANVSTRSAPPQQLPQQQVQSSSTHSSRSSSRPTSTSGGSTSTRRTNETDILSTISSGTGNTAREFAEDDGDIASIDGDVKTPRGGFEMILEQQQMQERKEDELQQQQQHSSDQPTSTNTDHSTSSSSILLASSTRPSVAPLHGSLLDGYRLLSSSHCELPEELSRLVLDGCEPPLVETVPEHLVEFTNLTYLDCSSNNLAFDRLRTLPQLDELNISCNNIREISFPPLPGIHYTLDSLKAQGLNDPNELEYNQTDLIGFPSLTKCDMSYNYIGTTANSADSILLLSYLPVLSILSLQSNYISSLPLDCTRFTMLTKLVLRDNALGSGTIKKKAELKEEQAKESNSMNNATTTTASSSKKSSTETSEYYRRFRRNKHDGDHIHKKDVATEEEELYHDKYLQQERMLQQQDEEDESPSAAEIRSIPYHAEWKLFHSLSQLSALQELDLSSNLIQCVPEGCIPPLPAFEKLQFLNLSLNQFSSEEDILPLADLPCLKWLDVRGCEFVKERVKEVKRRGRIAPISTLSAATTSGGMLNRTPIDYALEFPSLTHVLVDTCHIRIVMSNPLRTSPLSSGSTLQQDVSHILQPLPEGCVRRMSVSFDRNQRRMTGENILDLKAKEEKEEKRRKREKLLKIQQQQQHAAPQGFSTAHEFLKPSSSTSALNESKEEYDDSLQQFVGQQRLAIKPAPAASSTKRSDVLNADDHYASQYHAYNNTFLTGVNVEEIQSTPAFSKDVEQEPPTSLPHHLKPLKEKTHVINAEATLRAMLNSSSVSLRSGGVRAGGGANSKIRLSSSIRQPKVSKVYREMEEVLDTIEKRYTKNGATSSASTLASSTPPRKSGRRGVTSSSYVDPSHERTLDRVRAARHLEKEKQDVNELIRAVAEVSAKVNG